MYDKSCWSVNEVNIGCNKANSKNYDQFIKATKLLGKVPVDLCYCNTDYCNVGGGAVGYHKKFGTFIFLMMTLMMMLR